MQKFVVVKKVQTNVAAGNGDGVGVAIGGGSVINKKPEAGDYVVSQVKMSGYLKKKRNRVGGWRKLWFILQNQLLLSYTSREDYEKRLAPFKDVLNLVPGTIIRPTTGPRFTIETTSSTIYTFRCEDTKMCANWITALVDSLSLGAQMLIDKNIIQRGGHSGGGIGGGGGHAGFALNGTRASFQMPMTKRVMAEKTRHWDVDGGPRKASSTRLPMVQSTARLVERGATAQAAVGNGDHPPAVIDNSENRTTTDGIHQFRLHGQAVRVRSPSAPSTQLRDITRINRMFLERQQEHSHRTPSACVHANKAIVIDRNRNLMEKPANLVRAGLEAHEEDNFVPVSRGNDRKLAQLQRENAKDYTARREANNENSVNQRTTNEHNGHNDDDDDDDDDEEDEDEDDAAAEVCAKCDLAALVGQVRLADDRQQQQPQQERQQKLSSEFNDTNSEWQTAIMGPGTGHNDFSTINFNSGNNGGNGGNCDTGNRGLEPLYAVVDFERKHAKRTERGHPLAWRAGQQWPVSEPRSRTNEYEELPEMDTAKKHPIEHIYEPIHVQMERQQDGRSYSAWRRHLPSLHFDAFVVLTRKPRAEKRSIVEPVPTTSFEDMRRRWAQHRRSIKSRMQRLYTRSAGATEPATLAEVPHSRQRLGIFSSIGVKMRNRRGRRTALYDEEPATANTVDTVNKH